MKKKISIIVVLSLMLTWLPSCTTMKIEHPRITKNRKSHNFNVLGVVTHEGKYVKFVRPGKWEKKYISGEPLKGMVFGPVMGEDGIVNIKMFPIEKLRRIHWEKFAMGKTVLRYLGLSLGFLVLHFVINPPDF